MKTRRRLPKAVAAALKRRGPPSISGMALLKHYILSHLKSTEVDDRFIAWVYRNMFWIRDDVFMGKVDKLYEKRYLKT